VGWLARRCATATFLQVSGIYAIIALSSQPLIVGDIALSIPSGIAPFLECFLSFKTRLILGMYSGRGIPDISKRQGKR
jgi:hypothetical protein